MKKILTHLTGIVFLITILVAGGCGNSKKQNDSIKEAKELAEVQDEPTTVTIYLKAIRTKGKKHLEMYDSNDPNIVVVDNLETLVMPGDTVVWEIISQWRMKKMTKIGRQTTGEIIDKDAEQIPDSKNFSLIIPDDAPWDTTEKYDIEFKGWLGRTWTIDPYLKIPPKPPTP